MVQVNPTGGHLCVSQNILYNHSGHTRRSLPIQVCVSDLDTAQPGQLLIVLFLALCIKDIVSNFLPRAVHVFMQLSADSLSTIKTITDVSRLLVVNMKHWPKCFSFTFALWKIYISFPHFLVEYAKIGLISFHLSGVYNLDLDLDTFYNYYKK